MQPIFISHSSKDFVKAMTLVEEIEKYGGKCWIAPRDIDPGKDYGVEIFAGIRLASIVIVILSRNAISSRHVLREVDFALEMAKIILPMDIDQTILSGGLEYRLCTLQRWDCTTDLWSKPKIHKMLDLAGFPSPLVQASTQNIVYCGGGEKPMIRSATIGEKTLRIGGINDVIEWGWDGIQLLDEFIRLDYETLDALDGESEGHSMQWAPIFMHHPDTWRMLLTRDDTIAGYWHFAPLFSDDFELSLEGSLMDSELTIDRVAYFELPGHYDVYMCQTCLRHSYRSTSTVRMLLESIVDVIEELASQDVFISRMSANAYTAAGHGLCKTFRMRYLRPHRHSGAVYFAPIDSILTSPIALRRHSLLDAYKSEGLL